MKEYTIPIYRFETEDGIAEQVKSSAAIAYTSSVHGVHLNTNQELQLKEWLETSHAMANPNQFDLFYLESILASLGWNQNDDVFDKAEMWTARNTPVDKPFNYMHNEKDIIGHLTSSKVVDFNGSIIDTSISNIELLPDQFDIVVGAVLYRNWTDETLQTRMNKIIADISLWCVSMECLFRNFDYAILSNTEDGSAINKILARNDQTSFLTKHLKMYGGTGEYGGYRVGRLLRNFTFSGKGLVDNPANPRSHITSFNDKSETSSFVGVLATAEELQISKEENRMANEVVYTKEQYDALKAELDQFKAVSQQATKDEMDGLKNQIADLSKTVSTLSSELEASKEVSIAKETKVVALETELTETNEKLAAAVQSIRDAEIEAINASRKALLLERVDAEKVDNLIQKFANASQEMFDALIDSLPVLAKCGDKKKDEAAVCDDEEEDMKDGKAEEVVTDLEDAKAEDSADMASGGTQEEETLRSKASAWFSSNVLRSTHKQ